MTKRQEQERQEAIDSLKRYLPEGGTIYYVPIEFRQNNNQTHCLFVIQDGRPWNICKELSDIGLGRWDKHGNLAMDSNPGNHGGHIAHILGYEKFVLISKI